MAFTVTSVNVNGIRAAHRKGMMEWLDANPCDVLLLQEVRADEEIATELLGDSWESIILPCRIKGRAGVAVAVRKDSAHISGEPRLFLDDQETDVDSGRWLEATVETGQGRVRVVSAYFHSGEKDTPKQDAKMAHLPRIAQRMGELLSEAAQGQTDVLGTVVAGDFNIVRTRSDIKNWTSNHNKRAGVLDEEIAFLDQWLDAGWHDVMRDLAGDVQGPYTWWSQRGQAFTNDTGWRIDYQFATPALAEKATSFSIGRAASYEERWSDHAPLSVSYEL